MRFSLFRKKKRRSGFQARRAESAFLHLECLEGRTLPTVVSPVFAELQANLGVTHLATNSMPSVGVDQTGNFDVAFTQNVSATQTQVVVSRFKADGTPQTTLPSIVVATGGAAGTPAAVGSVRIAVRNTGTFVVAYVAPSTSGNFSSVFVKRYSANGTPNNPIIQVATSGFDMRNQLEPSVAVIDVNGAFYVSWTDQAAVGNGDIRVRGFNASGAAINTTDLAIAATAANEHESAIAVRPNTASSPTAVVVSFTRDGAGNTQNVFGRRFNTNLVGQGAEFQVNTTAGAASQSGVAIDSSLNFVVTWTDSTTPTNTDVKMRRYNATGVAQTALEEIVDNSAGNQSQPRVAKAGDDGRYVVAYTDASSGTNRISYAEFSTAGVLQTVKKNFTTHTSVQFNPAIGASHNGIFAVAADDNFTGQNEPWARVFKRFPSAFFAVGGAPGRVEVRKTSDGSLFADFQPYGAGYTGGVSVAWGDVNGDGIPDLVVGATVGNPDVRVYDGKAFANNTFNPANADASRLAQWFPYALQFNVGANVATGDVTGTGYADIVTGATAGNPDVRVYRGKDIAMGTFNPAGASQVTQFFAYGLQFNVGANVAVGDLNKDGYADIVTGATVGNPHVKVYSGQPIATGTFNPSSADASLIIQFFAYGQQFNVGAFVAVGDTRGTGTPDIITGATAGNPHVKVYNGVAINSGTFDTNNPDANLQNQFFAYGLQFNVGAAVGAGDIESTGKFDILTGASRGSPHYRIVSGNATGNMPPSVKGIEGIPSNLQGGVSVGGL